MHGLDHEFGSGHSGEVKVEHLEESMELENKEKEDIKANYEKEMVKI